MKNDWLYNEKWLKLNHKINEGGGNMTNKQKEIEKLLEKVNDDLSNKEKMFVLGVIEGLKLAKTAI